MKIERILSVVDTREYIERTDGREGFEPVPGSGVEHECYRCGRLHEVHATVLLADGQTVIVGTGCMGKDDAEMGKRFSSADRAAKRLQALRAEYARMQARHAAYNAARQEVLALEAPAVEVVVVEDLGNYTRCRFVCGDVDNVRGDLYRTVEARERNERIAERTAAAVNCWREKRMVERGAERYRPYSSKDYPREIAKVERRLADLLAA